MKMSGQRHHPATLRQERLGTHCIGSWVGPGDGLKVCGNISLPPGFDLRAVQPVASRYTDCAKSARNDMQRKYFYVY
jgi:hypothetical protein